MDFMAKLLLSSGQSETTHLPPPFNSHPPKIHHHDSLEEAQTVLFPAIDDLLTRTGLSSQVIDFLILNCSAFCPSPSLSSIIVYRYSMRSDIKSYNLSGLGSGAGMLAVDMATRHQPPQNPQKPQRPYPQHGDIDLRMVLQQQPNKARPKLFLPNGGRRDSFNKVCKFKNSAKYRYGEPVRSDRLFINSVGYKKNGSVFSINKGRSKDHMKKVQPAR